MKRNSGVNEMKPAKCRVTEVTSPLNSVMLVSFPRGELIPEKAHKLKCELYSHRKTGEHVVTVAADGHSVFGGSVIAAGNGLYRSLIAIRNKRTNTVRLISTMSVMLSPIFHVEKTNSVSVVTQEDKDRLRMTFGSKKQQQSLENYKRTHADENAQNDNLKSVGGSASVEDDHLQPVDTTSNEEYLPPMNRGADTVEDVYNLHDIISAEELSSLQEQAVTILTDPQKDMFSEFFWKTLPNMLEQSNSQLVVEGVCGLMYAELLLNFLSIHPKKLQGQKDAICPYSEELNSKIINTFTLQSPTGRMRSSSLSDKALCHLIILGLLLSQYKLDLELLSRSLGTSLKRLHNLSSQVGAVPISRASSTVVLKLPLPLLKKPRTMTKKK